VRTLPKLSCACATLIAVVALTASTSGAAGIQWGLRGGWNLDSISDVQSGSIEDSFSAATGYNFGVFGDVGIGPLHLRPGLTYIKTGSVFDGTSVLSTDEFDLSYVVVPVDVVVGLGIPIVSPYVATGPEFRVLASSGDAPQDFEDQLKSVGATWGLALGFELGAPGAPVRFLPEVRYSFDLSSITEETYEIGSTTVTSDGKLTSWRFSLGMMF
jgi:hypothetical protein